MVVTNSAFAGLLHVILIAREGKVDQSDMIPSCGTQLRLGQVKQV